MAEIFILAGMSGAYMEKQHTKNIAGTHQKESELSAMVEKLEKANAELRQARRAALNLIEDTMASKEALRINEERMRRQKEAFLAAIDGAALSDSINRIASLVTEETNARTAFFRTDEHYTLLMPLYGAGNMPITFLQKLDRFKITKNSPASCLLMGKPILTSDVFCEPLWAPWRHLATEFNFRSCWSFPIKKRDNKSVAIFSMYFEEMREGSPAELALAEIVIQTASVLISNFTEAMERALAEEALRKSKEKYRTELEHRVQVRTQELNASKELLQATIDNTLDIIQVFKAVRNENNKIIDFLWLMNNKNGIKQNGDVLGKRLLSKNPGIKEAGIFDKMVEVVEFETPFEYEQFYDSEKFKGWYYLALVKSGDGVVMTTRDITEQKKTEKEILHLKDEIARKATDKYHSLFNSIDEGFHIIELIYDEAGTVIDFRYLETNSSFERHTGLKNAAGKLGSEISPNTESYWFEAYNKVVQTGEPVRFENYNHFTGRWYSTYAFQVASLEPTHVAVLFNDITERKQREEEQQFLLHLSDILNPIADPVSIEETVSRVAMDHFRTERCYYCTIDGDDVVVNRDAYRVGLPSVVGRYPLNLFSIYKKVVNEGHPFIVHDVHTTPLLDEALKDVCIHLQIISFINIPVIKDGKAAGIFCLVQSTPRMWKQSEIDLAKETAERTWSAVERAKAEEALKTSEEKYRAMFETMIEACCIFELIYDDLGKPVDWIILEANAGYEKESGLKNVAGKLASEVMPGTEEYWIETFARVAETGVEEQIEKWHQPTERWIHSSTARVGGPGSKRLVSVFYDITERKRQEQRKEFFLKLNDSLRPTVDPNEIRREAMRLLRHHLGCTLVAYSEVSEDEEFVTPVAEDRDPEFISMLGTRFRWTDLEPEGAARFRRRESIQRDDLQNDWELPEKQKATFAAMAIGSYLVTPLVKNGRLVACLAAYNTAAHKWTSEEIRLLEEVGERTWVTIEKARAETALRKSEIKYRTLFTSIEEGFLLVEVLADEKDHPVDLLIVEVNDACQRQLNLENITGRRLLELMPQLAPTWIEFCGKVALSGNSGNLEFYIQQTDRWYNAHASRVGEEASRQVAIVFDDITRQKLFTEELSKLVGKRTKELKRSNEDLRQFAHVASHDLKEPVRKMKIFYNRIISEYSDQIPDKALTYLNKIGASTYRMTSMIDGVFRYAQIENEELKLEPVDLNNILQQIEADLELLIHEKEAKITFTKMPVIQANPFLMYQLFSNLLLNSLKFSKVGVPARIAITCEEATQDNIAFYQVVLSDNGIGFEKEFEKTIFKSFTRLNSADEYEGSGLGLALCKKIVERHKGNISATGQLDTGAVFTILLPAQEVDK